MKCDEPNCDREDVSPDPATSLYLCPPHQCNCHPEETTGGYHRSTCPQFDPDYGRENVQW